MVLEISGEQPIPVFQPLMPPLCEIPHLLVVFLIVTQESSDLVVMDLERVHHIIFYIM